MGRPDLRKRDPVNSDPTKLARERARSADGDEGVCLLVSGPDVSGVVFFRSLFGAPEVIYYLCAKANVALDGLTQHGLFRNRELGLISTRNRA